MLVAAGFGIRALVDDGSANTASGSAQSGSSETVACASAASGSAAKPALAAVVGPPAGADIPSYIQTRRAFLQECANQRPDERGVAIVSFAGSANPAGAAALIGHVSILAAYVRLPGEKPLILPVPTPLASSSDQAPAISEGYVTLATALQLDADAHPERAATELPRITALRQDCGCVYAVAVAASLRTLAALNQSSTVRLTDLAPPGFDMDRISARPILPSEIVALDPMGTPSVFSPSPSG